MRTLVLGGYGNFGARICRALSAEPSLQLLIGGRDTQRARAFAAGLGGTAQGIGLDLTAPGLAERLRDLGIDLLIHTAGPFQGSSWDVALAAAHAGADYIDLADGRRFVCDFPSAVGPAFGEAGRVGITGASTVPALSSAVVDDLVAGWRTVDRIDVCVAPAQTAPRGKATLAAVLSYCGAPIQVWDAGRWKVRHGWAAPERVEFHRMRSRLGALCDVPDLELFPARYGVTGRVTFKAALEVGLTQRAMAAVAAVRRVGVLRHPEWLAALVHRTARGFDPFGSALGGMVVRASGTSADGGLVARAWHLIADHDHGPEIPCMPAILLARKLARGIRPEPGAMSCMNLLSLEEFIPEFQRWGMVADTLDEAEVAVGTSSV